MIEALLALLIGQAAPAQCKLRAEDLAANARLTFQQFDQQGSTSTTARKLAERGCFTEAVEAYRHYLLHGPIGTDYERNVMRWHMGQYLASAGREQEAALLLVSTRRGVDPKRPTFDWDSYVVGTYAFLTKNRPLLDQMAARLSASDQFGNLMNGKVLRRFQKCFDQPYSVAYSDNERCAVPDEAPHKH